MDITENDLSSLELKQFKISCCRSYLTPKGRCYTCPEDDYEDEDDNSEEE